MPPIAFAVPGSLTEPATPAELRNVLATMVALAAWVTPPAMGTSRSTTAPVWPTDPPPASAMPWLPVRVIVLPCTLPADPTPMVPAFTATVPDAASDPARLSDPVLVTAKAPPVTVKLPTEAIVLAAPDNATEPVTPAELCSTPARMVAPAACETPPDTGTSRSTTAAAWPRAALPVRVMPLVPVRVIAEPDTEADPDRVTVPPFSATVPDDATLPVTDKGALPVFTATLLALSGPAMTALPAWVSAKRPPLAAV